MELQDQITIEQNLAHNITELRKNAGLKQAELGEKIGYSDKTVSKWENGSSVPDVAALASLAEVFGVSLDDLIREDAVQKAGKETQTNEKRSNTNRIILLFFNISLIWLIATAVYAYLKEVKGVNMWQIIFWSLPVTCAYLWWINHRHYKSRVFGILSFSALLWTLITSIYLQFLPDNLWILFVIGAPAQVSVIFSFFILKR